PSSVVYSINPAAASDSGSYQLVASNSFGATTSAVAVVVVQVSPAVAAPGFFRDAGAAGSSDAIGALQPMLDGRLIIGGSFTQLKTNGATSVFRSYLAAFTTNGIVDPFSPAPDNIINDAIRQSDGKIVVAGLFQNMAGNVRKYIARFNTNLTFDTNFSTTLGLGPDAAVNDIALQPDGKILLAGTFTAVSGQPNTRGIARLNSDGSVDTTFASAYTSFGSGTLVDILPDGRIVFVGSGSYGGASASVYRINTNGTVDATFTNILGAAVTALAVMPDGGVLVGGTFLTLNGKTRPILARLIQNGAVDFTFFADATNTTALNQSSIKAICIQENGKILAGGTFLTFGPFRNGLARFNADGTVDTSFVFQQGYGDSSFANSINRIVTFADGRVAIGGTFATWEGVAENNLAILNGDPASTNTYSVWSFNSGLTAGNNDPAADPDNDGVPNIFEYYSGTNPTNAASALRPVNAVVQIGAQSYPAIKFVRSKNITGVTLMPKVSANVSFSNSLGWTLDSTTDLGDGTDQLVIRSNASTASNAVQFLEILLQLNP
ncbi:MAG: hypothetical protein JWO95_1762, partial [Verrucomicrobiales bacterium]|nr:hypothetical protein [Verrucomicrobiales bacterium]